MCSITLVEQSNSISWQSIWGYSPTVNFVPLAHGGLAGTSQFGGDRNLSTNIREHLENQISTSEKEITGAINYVLEVLTKDWLKALVGTCFGILFFSWWLLLVHHHQPPNPKIMKNHSDGIWNPCLQPNTDFLHGSPSQCSCIADQWTWLIIVNPGGLWFF